MPKDNLRDKLEGNELDLSLNNLSTVPVKELSAIPKGTKLDLSCNLLVNLPDNFGTLVHLVKIDFSKNQLAELPDNFGDLRNLQHLDLLGNQLTILPISFHKLTKLKWLDLKDNPLKDDLKHAAGDCLDEAQCKQCAQNVLIYMKAIHNELERRRQRKLLREREEEDLRRALEESEMERVRQERKNKKKNNKGNKVPKPATTVPTEEKSDKQTVNGGKHQEKVKIQAKKSSGLSLAWIWLSLLILLASLCGSSYFCEQNENNYICSSYVNPAVQQSWKGYEHAKNTISNIYEGVKSSRNKNTSTEDESLPKQKKNTDKPISEKNKDFTSETGNQQKAKPNMQ